MTEAVFHDCALVVTAVLGAYSAYKATRAEKATTETHAVVGEFGKKMDGLLDARVKAAGDVGEAKGRAAGKKEKTK